MSNFADIIRRYQLKTGAEAIGVTSAMGSIVISGVGTLIVLDTWKWVLTITWAGVLLALAMVAYSHWRKHNTWLKENDVPEPRKLRTTWSKEAQEEFGLSDENEQRWMAEAMADTDEFVKKGILN